MNLNYSGAAIVVINSTFLLYLEVETRNNRKKKQRRPVIIELVANNAKQTI